jgi:hypothetical protein
MELNGPGILVPRCLDYRVRQEEDGMARQAELELVEDLLNDYGLDSESADIHAPGTSRR